MQNETHFRLLRVRRIHARSLNMPKMSCTCGFVHNLTWVTLGNAISGVTFMGVGYWFVSSPPGYATPALAKSSVKV